MKIIITGGAGFVGSNAASWYGKAGHKVVVLDNLSRRGSEANLAWLRKTLPKGILTHEATDVRSMAAVDRALAKHGEGADLILHLAAQVAVTTSVEDPRHDFAVNALGTFNVLQAVRKHAKSVPLIYSSTNKVYGGMTGVKVKLTESRYEYEDFPQGIDEGFPLDFHSPYGCSKGTADQYARDYARIYGLKTLVYRQSCIYGERQFGVEDQGWVAWFIIARLTGKPITIYGDGKQVRDVLHVEDLVRAYEAGRERADENRGEVFNIGGGAVNAIPVASVIENLNRILNEPYDVDHKPWRPGDQPIFICDIRKAKEMLGWEPAITAAQGMTRLYEWVRDNLDLFKEKPAPPAAERRSGKDRRSKPREPQGRKRRKNS